MKKKNEAGAEGIFFARPLFAFLISFALFASLAFAVSVERTMPQRVDPSAQFTVSFAINPEGALNSFDVSDFVPEGWNLNEWSVSGYDRASVSFESQTREYQGKQRNALHWKFNAALSAPATLSYTMNAPGAAGTYEFIAVWIYPGGFSSKSANLEVGTAEPSPAPAPSPQPSPAPSPTPEQPSPRPLPEDNTRLLIIVLAIVVIIGAAYYLRKPKKA